MNQKSFSAKPLAPPGRLGVDTGPVLLAGCISVGPDYQQPETGMPDAWNQAVSQDLGSGAPVLVSWWQVLDDPVLSDLIAQAAVSNLDVKVVMARLEAAGAAYGVARSAVLADRERHRVRRRHARQRGHGAGDAGEPRPRRPALPARRRHGVGTGSVGPRAADRGVVAGLLRGGGRSLPRRAGGAVRAGGLELRRRAHPPAADFQAGRQYRDAEGNPGHREEPQHWRAWCRT